MKILIVDDDQLTLNVMLELLGRQHVVDCVLSGPEALRQYEGKRHDVVVTDYNMPGMTGIEVLQVIRAMNPDARVMILTGYADVENAIEAVNNGAYAFFRKPLDVPDFLKTLQVVADEMDRTEQKKINYARLAGEYAKLREAYDQLSRLMKAKGGKSEVVNSEQ